LVTPWSAHAQAPAEPFAPDSQTLLLAHFDGQGAPDFAIGSQEPEGYAELEREGRFGGALAIGGGQQAAFAADDGNFPLGQGTVEMWIRPRWDGNDGKVRLVLGTRGTGSNYLNINKLANNRFGYGISGQPEGQKFTYARLDRDVSEWSAGEWHHVAVCWSGSWAALWLDGELVSETQQALGPCVLPSRLSLMDGAGCVDELRISNVVRYGPRAWQPGQPGPERVRPKGAGRRWVFNEPEGVYRHGEQVPDRSPGFRVAVKSYLDELTPEAPLPWADRPALTVAVTPAEFEPAAFVLLATRDLAKVRIRATEPDSGIRVEVRRVIRTPMRRLYTAKRDNTRIVSRFLPRWTPIDVPRGEVREVWLTVYVPSNAAPGEHTGAVDIAAESGALTVPLRVKVYPFTLADHPRKHLGTYYRMAGRLLNPPRLRRELADMRAHGVRSIFSGLHIDYAVEGERVTPLLGSVRRGLEYLKEAGFDESVVVDTGFMRLAGILGHRDIRHGEAGESLDETPRFQAAARRTMEAFVALDREYPQFRLAATHLDEVFNRGRLPLYIRLTKAAQQVPDVRMYITFHTVADRNDVMRKEIDPFVDIRCNHGYSFEWWLGRGHTIEDYETELRESGDEAWFYHNARGVHFTAEWSRIINGLYLWASPFRVHVPWTYQSYRANPFDDTDGAGHDFGMSFPGPEDRADLVPTRLWEALREGGDDLRYIATLEAAIAANRERKPIVAAAAQAYLDKLSQLVQRVRVPAKAEPAAEEPPAGRREIDLDTGLVMGVGRVGSAEESPLINALAQRFSGSDWQRVRAAVAQHIGHLTAK